MRTWFEMIDDLKTIANEMDDKLTQEMLTKKPPIPTGRWDVVSTFPIRWKCSICKTDYERGFNYCPNCGADMRGIE